MLVRWRWALYLTLVACSTFGQAVTDLATRYRQVSAFEIRPGVLMMANFADDGNVCEAALEKPLRLASKDVPFSPEMSRELVAGIEEELAPASERGVQNRWLDPESFVAGGASFLKRDFESVTIEEHASFSCNQGKCRGGDPQLVVVRWKHRKCSENGDSIANSPAPAVPHK